MKQAVRRRKIACVYHFTRLENIGGILKHGLLGRTRIEELGIESIFNDGYRYDECENASCCSIGHPNYKMFYSLRMSSPRRDWAVIGLKPSVLWKNKCAFCVTNASSNAVTCIPLEQRMGVDAFEKMFGEREDKPARIKLGISNDFPTDPQAEVLVLDDIGTENILVIVVEFQAIKIALEKTYPDYKFVVDSALFFPRKDHKHWH